MKKYFVLLLLPVSFFSRAAVVRWDGEAGDGLWISASNWNNDILPGATDTVVLDNLFVAGAYAVSLPAGAVTVSVLSLIINPSVANNITLLLPLSNTANPGLNITGTGDALVLNSGAILKNSSGASSGSGVAITGTFRINNGARYIHNTSRGNASIVSQLSTSAGTETGVFEYSVPAAAYTLSLSNRVYGTVELSTSAPGGMTTYAGSGANPLRIRGDFRINSGVKLSTSMTADIIIMGNYGQAGASTFDVQTSAGNNVIKIQGNIVSLGSITESGTGLPVLELNGTANQDITLNAVFSNSLTVRINNPAGVTLLSPLIIPFQLQLVNGKIKTSTTNLLVMADHSNSTGGSTISFVEGPMKKAGSDTVFVFPVGKGSVYAPVTFHSSGMAVTDTVLAEYIRANPQMLYGTDFEPVPLPEQINHISYVEYWMLRKTAGISLPFVITLPVTVYSFSTNMNSTFIARYNVADMQWKHTGVSSLTIGVSSPPYVTGTVASAALSADGIFTLYSSDAAAVNPLPLRIIAFEAKAARDGKVLLQWQLADEFPSPLPVEVERAGIDQQFRTMAVVNADRTKSSYSCYDEHPVTGINYYRLKIKNADQMVTYSHTSTFQNPGSNVFLISLFPTITGNHVMLTVSSSAIKPFTVMIADMEGKIVRADQQQLTGILSRISLSLYDLPAGMYMVWGVSGMERTNAVKVIKR